MNNFALPVISLYYNAVGLYVAVVRLHYKVVTLYPAAHRAQHVPPGTHPTTCVFSIRGLNCNCLWYVSGHTSCICVPKSFATQTNMCVLPAIYVSQSRENALQRNYVVLQFN